MNMACYEGTQHDEGHMEALEEGLAPHCPTALPMPAAKTGQQRFERRRKAQKNACPA